ncbi:MAG: hypothetical protein LUD72_07845 [Bacteroidales bacterium]|nr:hypothetical protein [Bacteroidales bacterium]
MEKQEFYKVLWVEDDEEIIGPTQSRAEEFGLNLVRFSNWAEAEEELDANFKEYSAIILDANCKVKRGSSEDASFIPLVLLNMATIFTRRGEQIPWYILSAGTMSNFDFVKETAEKSRADFKDEWGEMLFLKKASNDKPESQMMLFRQIAEVAERRFENSVLGKHRQLFSYLGEGRIINYPEARRYMLRMLDVLYFPEGNMEYEYEGNPLRKVLEYLFRAAAERGLLPEDCFDDRYEDRNVVLQNAYKFMSGRDVVFAESGKVLYKVRWGEAGMGKDGGGKGGDRIFNKEAATSVKIVLDYANRESHSDEGETYVINEAKREAFLAYVMHLCYIIRQFGKYVERHPNAEENRKMHRYTDCINLTAEDVIGEKFLARNEGDFYRAGRCKLSEDCGPFKDIVGHQYVIEEVVQNTGKDKWRYPFIATKITLVTEE